MSVKQRMGLQQNLGTTLPDQMWVFNNERLILMTFQSGLILDVQVSFRPDPCFETNFVTKRHQGLGSAVTAAVYTNGVPTLGFGCGLVKGFIIGTPGNAVNLELDNPTFVIPSAFSCGQKSVKNISIGKYHAAAGSVNILVQYCDTILLKQVHLN